jgi:hypothetical protein
MIPDLTFKLRPDTKFSNAIPSPVKTSLSMTASRIGINVSYGGFLVIHRVPSAWMSSFVIIEPGQVLS